MNILSSTTNSNSFTLHDAHPIYATDACGNHSATVTQTITATDTHAPTIGAAGSNATIDCTASPSFTAPTASDDCSEIGRALCRGRTTCTSCWKVSTAY